MKKNLLTLILFFLTLSLSAQPYLPKGSGQVIEHKYYTLSYVEEHEQAQWVYYYLSKEMLEGTAARKDDFREDPMVVTRSATLADYKGSGYDRGHLCSAADMVVSAVAMSESFYMSNMSPQAPSLNRGKWKSLEEQVRKWAKEKGEIYVVTGPVFKDNLGEIGEGVTVPGYYYKVIYDPKAERMFAAVMPNRKCTEDISTFVVSVDSVEALTGLDFFSQLPDALENRLESAVTIMSGF